VIYGAPVGRKNEIAAEFAQGGKHTKKKAKMCEGFACENGCGRGEEMPNNEEQPHYCTDAREYQEENIQKYKNLPEGADSATAISVTRDKS